MDFDFSLFEKCKEIYNGVRKMAWNAVALVGSVTFIVWSCVEWVAARAVSLINWLKSFVPNMDINPANVTGVDWARINQFVPINEGFMYLKLWLALAGALIFIRLFKKLLPIG